MVTLAFIVSEKTPGQTDKKTYKQTNKQTDKRRRKDYSRRATITNPQTNRQERKDYSRRATIKTVLQSTLALNVFAIAKPFIKILECFVETPCVKSNPCENGGRCYPSSRQSKYRCSCARFYYGDNCEKGRPR